MKTTLLFAPPSKRYESLTWSTEKLNDPLLSGSAILAAYLKEKCSNAEVECLGDQVVTGTEIQDYSFRHRTVDEMVRACEESDIVGMTVLFHNLSKSLEIADRLKQDHPDKKIVLGGQAVSNTKTARQILKRYSSIDFVVRGDGEETLRGIVEGINFERIPNLFYRNGSDIANTSQQYFDLNKRPIFNFTSAPDHEAVLRAFDSRTSLFTNLRRKYGNFIGRIGVQSTTGCEKAAEMGPCRYCTSQRTVVQQMAAEKFWQQVEHLYATHGLTELFITDDVVAIPEKVEALQQTRPNFSLPEDIQLRAYGYVPYFVEDAEKMAESLRMIGVSNLFLGIENFYAPVNKLSNKPGFDVVDVDRVVGILKDNEIDVFLPIMIGLPGESQHSMEYNARCLDSILRKHAKQKYGKGGVVRVDLSRAMPLRGTYWYHELSKDETVQRHYQGKTGKCLAEEIDPDYDILRETSILCMHPTDINLDQMNSAVMELERICCRYLRPEQVGGFDYRPMEKTR